MPVDNRLAPVISIYRRHRQNDTTSYVGIIIFVASWTMMFAALFMSYGVLRIRAVTWPPPGTTRLPIGLPLLATVVLALSSACLQRGLGLVRAGEVRRYLAYLLGAMALGTLFLALQCVVWWSLWNGGLDIHTGLYGGLYLLTCLHAVHVLVGLAFLAWLLPVALRGVDLAAKVGRLGVVTVYWHFVGVVWAVMYVS